MKRFFLMVMLMAVLAIGVSSVGAQQVQPPERAIQVTGLGVIPLDPNGAFFDVVYENLTTDLTVAYREAVAAIAEISSTVVAIGVAPEDIRLADLNITAEDRVDQVVGPTGQYLYRTKIVIRVTIRQISLLDAVVQGAVDAGASSVINYYPLYDDVRAAEQRAREQALANAAERAQAIAETYGLELGLPVAVAETVETGFSAIRRADANSGRFTVTVTTVVTYEATDPTAETDTP